MSVNKKALSFLAIIAKAGKIASGEFSTEEAIKSGKAHLVILAEDASNNTKKHFSDMCTYRKVPYFELGTKDEIGHMIGKEFRASVAVIDAGLADAMRKKLVNE